MSYTMNQASEPIIGNAAILLLCLISPSLAAEYVFAPEGCEYSITLPGTPELTTSDAEVAVDGTEAYYDEGDGFFIRAQCSENTIEDTEHQAYAKLSHKIFMETWNLKPIDYAFSVDRENGTKISFSGEKTLNGEPVVYRRVEFIGKGSVFSVSSGMLKHYADSETVEKLVGSILANRMSSDAWLKSNRLHNSDTDT